MTKRKNIINTNKHRQLVERDLVNLLVRKIDNEAGYSVMSHIDVDSPARMFQSGFDFYLTSKGRVIFIEAKRTLEKKSKSVDSSEKLFKMMRDSQRNFAVKCHQCKTPYYLLHFLVEEFSQIDICPDTHFDIDKNIKVNLYLVSVPQNKEKEYVFKFKEVLRRGNLDEATKYLRRVMR